MDTGTLRILTCDGGGIRGLLTTLLLQRLDQEFGILSRVSLFAGSSTGAIIALGLAADVPIAELVQWYLSKGPTIFQNPGSDLEAVIAGGPAGMPRAVLSLLPGDFIHVKYDNQGLRSVLQQLFRTNPVLRDLRPVLVTTFQLHNPERGRWAPLLLTNLAESPSAATPALDAALAATAAPIYFPPHLIEDPPYGYCVDGGMFANNPATLAMVMMLAAGYAPGQIRLLSVGTGALPNCIPAQRVAPPVHWGVFEWLFPFPKSPTPALPLLHAIWESFAEIDTFQCQQVLGPGFRRLNLPLPEPIYLNEYDKVGLMQEIVAQYAALPVWQEVRGWVQEKFH
ncbi:MAG: patatin-like phospholipase family protein [Gemmataceae bacterium]|nr:patatin-like phospholipase family protein [Gemmataceae bacterium]